MGDFGWQWKLPDHMHLAADITMPAFYRLTFTGRMFFTMPKQLYQNKHTYTQYTRAHLTALCPGLPG